MAALIDAIDVRRKMFFELENTPFVWPGGGGFYANRAGRADFSAPEDAQPTDPCRL